MNQKKLDETLIVACQIDDINEIKKLIQKGANVNYRRFSDDESAIFTACAYGNLNIVKILVENGAKVNLKNRYDQNVLFKSMYTGNLELFKYLIRYGVNFNDKFNNNSLIDCIISINKDLIDKSKSILYSNIVKYLKNDAYIESTLGINYDYTKSRKQQIIDAVKINPSNMDKLDKEELKNIPEIQHLIKSDEYGLFENNIGLNKKLKMAASKGDLELVKSLILQGADIHENNDKIITLTNYPRIIKFLVKSGINFDKIPKISQKIIKYKKEQAPIDYTLGLDYPYESKNRNEQIIDSVKKNPSIINNLPKENIENIPEIQYLLKSDEYGLFERKVMNFTKYIKYRKN